MVLAELGLRIAGAFKKLGALSVVDESIFEECLKEIVAALIEADVNVRYVRTLRENVRKSFQARADSSGASLKRLIQMSVLEELVKLLSPSKQPYVPKKGKSNVIMFVGLQGSGKTTSCTKFAAYYNRKGWKAALVCADTFRAGAFDQLKQNATKAKIPFYGSHTEADPVAIAAEGVEQFKAEKYELIIVDTSGRHKQEETLFQEMAQVSVAIEPDDIVFVMDSHIGQACFDQAEAFQKSVNVGSIIITKLDGHSKGGGALSAVAATNSPVIFIGTGEHFDDFELFQPKSFVSRLLGKGDVSGLLNTFTEVVPLEKQPEMMERLSRGKFSLRDMQEQYQNVLKLGSLSKVMSMIPGVGANQITKDQGEIGQEKIKRFMTIMDSMTAEELDSDKILEKSRLDRIVIGSGTNHADMKDLLDHHKMFQKMVGKMGKMGFTNEVAVQNMMRNPQQLMQRVQSMLNPKMLKQMGGAGNMVNLMKGLSQGDEMADMQDFLSKGMMGRGRPGKR